MMKIEIENRWNGAVLCATEVNDGDPTPMRTAIVRANLAQDELAELRELLEGAHGGRAAQIFRKLGGIVP